jgi:hypothetical protein
MKAMVIFMEEKQKYVVFFENPNKKPKKKTKCHFPAPPILNIFHENFRDCFLGE